MNQKRVKFCKMHGLGNDFVIIDTISQSIQPTSNWIGALSDRHCGIGFDQLLLIKKSDQADFYCQIFNSNGSEALQCGNGMRCIARYISEEKLCNKESFKIETKGGVVEVDLKDKKNISVSMGIPRFQEDCRIQLKTEEWITLSLVSIGNPHALLQVPLVKKARVTEIGQFISSHPIFAQGVNVGFMEILNPDHIRLRTFERGAGETLACGSNACAAVVAGIQKGILNKKVQVEVALGNLWINWEGENHPVIMKGPTARIFDGEVLL